MLNFRKIKQDYSHSLIKAGEELYKKGSLVQAEILEISGKKLLLSCSVSGNFDHIYKGKIEIDRLESTVIDADCNCPNTLDCHHLIATLFHLEENLNEMILNFSKEGKQDESQDEEEKNTLLETIKEATTKEEKRREVKGNKELLEDYVSASSVLGASPFFLADAYELQKDVELSLLVAPFALSQEEIEFQIYVKVPFRSKLVLIPCLREFFDSVRYVEPYFIAGKPHLYSLESFDDVSRKLMRILLDHARLNEVKGETKDRLEKMLKIGFIPKEAFGALLARSRSLKTKESYFFEEGEVFSLPRCYLSSLDEPFQTSSSLASLSFELEYLDSASPKILINPKIVLGKEKEIRLEEAVFFESASPGIFFDKTYYLFQPHLRRRHLRKLKELRDITIPEPLFGTFVENSLMELLKFGKIVNKEVIDRFVTLPFVGTLKAECDVCYLNGELEVSLWFIYGENKISAASSKLSVTEIKAFLTPEGVLARNLTEEEKLIQNLFQDFTFDPVQAVFIAKTERKVIEFMTETIPAYQHIVNFNCPENLKEQFIYDTTTFSLRLEQSKKVDVYVSRLEVHGYLKGFSLSTLWDCILLKKAFVEMKGPKSIRKEKKGETFTHKILVLDLEKLAPLIHIFDEMGIKELDNREEELPLWSLGAVHDNVFEGLAVDFSMTPELKEIRSQMLGEKNIEPKPIPECIKTTLRDYQKEGVMWLDKLRQMHLSGILADDMGLGKSLQAIVALTQYKEEVSLKERMPCLIVCPTSLVYNWKEEIHKFSPGLVTLPIDGTPNQRKKLLDDLNKYDVVITSYNLLQKDIEVYKEISFGYAILDEAQHIKNRGTRNAKSVKEIRAKHRLILTGTPIENSLEELWSLFDFLMPGFLSTYDRFLEKYVRALKPQNGPNQGLQALRRKASPFILRRMKKDVLAELPAVTEIVYHCRLTEIQKELYCSFAKSAREELSKLVKKEGFDKVQIHVLATLTRLKQICCHPAIFAKEKAEPGDSAKYDMLLEILESLMQGGHKTVIFSQYTKLLGILREDLSSRNIPFAYLDGSTKDRMAVVKEFNENAAIPIFLVSLKAGGTGLNLVGADTVIHYDMWWNPAVENQATDRVHRLGQKQKVSALKLVTLDTIEEKIVELQNRKKELVEKVVACDEDTISKLSWEEVLELLQT